MEQSLAIIAAACQEWLRQQAESGQSVKADVEAKKAELLAELQKPKVTP